MVLEWELRQKVIFKVTGAQPGNFQGRADFSA